MTAHAAARVRALDRFSVVVVAVAAALWASDAYFRPVLARELSASQIVLVENLLITLCFVPLAARIARELRGRDRREWLALIIIAVGPQALATVLFTRSLSYAFPAHAPPDLNVENEVYVLYLLQPFFAVAGARVVLGERRRPFFWPLALLAVAAVYLIVFPDQPLRPLSSLQQGQLQAALFVIGAIALWAAGTVLGRYALREVSFTTTTAMRFTLALPVLALLVLLDGGGAGFTHYSLSQLPSFAGIALVPGLVAMLLYYRGLASTPASLATFAELAYPCTLFLVFSLPPPVGLGTPLHGVEIVGAVLLAAAVTALNALKERQIVTGQHARLTPAGEAATP